MSWRGRLCTGGIAAVVFACALTGAPAAASPELPDGFVVQTVASGFDRPVGFAFAPDGRVFVVEQAGVLKVIDGEEVRTVLDLSARVSSNRTRGLLGVAADRDFAANGHLYLLYTAESDPLRPDGAGPTVSRLSRITVLPDGTVENPADPETVLVGTMRVTECPRPHSNDDDCIPADADVHAIGTVRVDPVDGTLWFGTGDAAGTDVRALTLRTYDENTYAGKLVHVGTNGRGLPGHPFCPGETDLTKVCTKIHSKGFRNPFRFTLRGDGSGPVVGDVGWVQIEEVDLPEPGGSYGWPCFEGAAPQDVYAASGLCDAEYARGPGAHLPPALAYLHSAGTSITGGPLYDATQFPTRYRGHVFYADYVAGWIRHARVTADDQLVDDAPFAAEIGAAVDLQQAPDGTLYYADIANGSIRLIAYDPLAAAGARTHTDAGTGDITAPTAPGESRGGPERTAAPPPAPRLELRLPRAGLRASRRGVIRIRVTNGSPRPMTGRLRVVIAGTLGKRRRAELADSTFTAPAGTTAVVDLRLATAHRRLLTREGRFPVKVWSSAADPAGATARSKTRATLRAPRR